MRSNTSRKSCRILVVFGQGIPAACGLQLLFLFSHAGFGVYPAVCAGSQGWIGLEALAGVTGVVPLSTAQTPLWSNVSDIFDVAVGLGLSVSSLRDLALKASDDPALNAMARRGRSLFLLTDPKTPLPPALAGDLKGRGYFLKPLPSEVTRLPEAFNKAFAEIFSFLRRRSFLGKYRVSVQRSRPPIFDSVGIHPPIWHDELRDRLSQVGFTLQNSGESSGDLVVETYEGPFVLQKANRREPTLTFDPIKAETPLPQAPVLVRFIHPECPETTRKLLDKQGIITVCRTLSGDLEVRDGSQCRLFPHLEERSALEKLVEFLIEKVDTIKK